MPFKTHGQFVAMMLSEDPKTREVARVWKDKYGVPKKTTSSKMKTKKKPRQ